jgi:NAD(P)-dependent dehydrogenase (short-subunit alcohol dehydrogenase family)
VGTANDIGAAIALLVSSDAQWISGQELLLTGGGKDY